VGSVAGSQPPLTASRAAGFTLLEILVVLVILSIAAGLAVVALGSDTRASLRREAQRFGGALEYAASRAQMRNETLGVDAAGRVVAAPLVGCGENFDVVVNATATSVAGAAVPVAGSVLRHGGLAVDMMYGPAAAPFVAWAAAHGASGRDGLGMLVEQAAEAFHLWRGVEPDTAPVLRALRARIAA